MIRVDRITMEDVAAICRGPVKPQVRETPCPACDGSGWVEVADDDPDGGSHADHCRKCDGTGRRDA